jgi:hypothetical protein
LHRFLRGPAGERRRCVSDVSVRVRISDFIGERRYAICVERPYTAAWFVDVDAARKLVRDLGQAIDAVERLEPFEAAGELAGEPAR